MSTLPPFSTMARSALSRLTGFTDYVDAVRSGIGVSPEIAGRYVPEMLAAHAADPRQRDLLIEQRDDALRQADLMQRIRGASPDGLREVVAEVAAMAPTVEDDADLALAGDRLKQQAALVAALETDARAREADPARYAASVSPVVHEAAAGIGRGGEEAYAAAMLAEQQRLGMQPRLLPVDTAKTLVGQIAETPNDVRGAALATLAEQWGEAWPRVLNEMKAAGLDPATYHAALVADDPALAERVASLAETPLAELVKGLPDTDIRDIRTSIGTGMADFRNVFEAGDPTGAAARTMNELQDIATGLAVQEYRRTGNVTGAAERAMWDLMDSRYHILDSRGFAAYVPRGVDLWKLEAAAAQALTDEALANVVPFGGDESDPDFIRRSRILNAAKAGTWVTNAEGDGLTLMVDVDGRWMPIMTDAGVYGITFEEAERYSGPGAEPPAIIDFYGRPVIQ